MANLFEGTTSRNGISVFLYRLVAVTVVLAVTAFLTPGFAITGFFPLIISALVISGLDYVVSKTGVNATPFGRGLTGFVLAALVIYFTQFIVSGYTVTFLSALIGAFIYGIIDAIIPGRSTF